MVVFRAPCGALFSEAAAREVLGAADSDASRECAGGLAAPVCAAALTSGRRRTSTYALRCRAVVLHRCADGLHSRAASLHRRVVDRQVPSSGAGVGSRIRVSAGPFDDPAEATVGFCSVESTVRELLFGTRDAEAKRLARTGLAEGRPVGVERAVPRHIEHRQIKDLAGSARLPSIRGLGYLARRREARGSPSGPGQ
jgi:hypothetical protein